MHPLLHTLLVVKYVAEGITLLIQSLRTERERDSKSQAKSGFSWGSLCCPHQLLLFHINLGLRGSSVCGDQLSGGFSLAGVQNFEALLSSR